MTMENYHSSAAAVQYRKDLEGLNSEQINSFKLTLTTIASAYEYGAISATVGLKEKDYYIGARTMMKWLGDGWPNANSMQGLEEALKKENLRRAGDPHELFLTPNGETLMRYLIGIVDWNKKWARIWEMS